MTKPPVKTERERILVIRLGALGDLVLCFQGFEEIRQHHQTAEIALLTMPAYATFGRMMPWFDTVFVDERAPVSDTARWRQLLNTIRDYHPHRVYDLQGKLRQTLLYMGLGGPFGPEWSGAAPFCSHPRRWPPTPNMNYTDFVEAQLRRAGVPAAIEPDLSWLDAPLENITLPESYVLLVPGCSPGREYKRWPPQAYADLAQRLHAQGVGAVAVGTKADRAAIQALCAAAPTVVDLCARTDLKQLARVSRGARAVIGNNSGPTHMAAAVGAPTIMLMDETAATVWSCPAAKNSRWIQGNPLSQLSVDEVFVTLLQMLNQ
ncbi:MAG: glycosyltransferase family 9 protein [Alphaproteobacteria bacterium]|nr:glycosyltransferase family 9 protein [Alphaproteobacteria bacterium]MBV8548419.1 glycosyltransferase family 9 protein [Alphaproteobacteria bacterium]